MICLRIVVDSDIHLDGIAVAARRFWTNFQLIEVAPSLYYGIIGGAPRRALFRFIEDWVPELYVVENMVPWLEFGKVEGYVADLPTPPLPGVGENGEILWSRIATRDVETRIGDVNFLLTDPPAFSIDYEDEALGPSIWSVPFMLTVRFAQELWPKNGRIGDALLAASSSLGSRGLELPPEQYPGSGRLVGEEFRIVEPEGDYLRLVGRGGDEYIAWDLVLGSLDTGEWILIWEYGL
jgi:hypothetical protein